MFRGARSRPELYSDRLMQMTVNDQLCLGNVGAGSQVEIREELCPYEELKAFVTPCQREEGRKKTSG